MLRLVGGVGDHDGLPVERTDAPPKCLFSQGSQRVEIVLKIEVAGAQIGLTKSDNHATNGAMQPSDALKLVPAATKTIEEAGEAWFANLAKRGKRPSTIKSYRTLLKSVKEELRWTSVADITEESVSAWAGEKRQSGAWSGTTMNRQVGAIQSLTRFLAKKRWIAVDPLLSLDRAEDDGGDGARAATTDEARALIRWAWERQQIDRRAVGNRALVWQCMFSMGLRASEPAAFTWGCLFLDESFPYIRWTRTMHKAYRPCDVALPLETIQLLRSHRASLGKASDHDPVFPLLPPRVTFRKDRDAAGIAAYDRRGRGFSPHSARKFLSHALTVAGVEGRVIDTLMRHSTGTPGRYPDLLPADQAPFLGLLPKLWPGNYSQELSTKSDHGLKSLDAGSRSGIVLQATSMNTSISIPVQSARPGVNASESLLDAPTWRADSAGTIAQPSGRASKINPLDLLESAEVRLALPGTTARLSTINKALDVANQALRLLGGSR